jgi:mono/diheme cytochrome c family protein
MPRSTLIALSLAFAAAAGLAGYAPAAEKLSYNEHIRPILVENCFGCHGADSAGRKADLRLDDRDAAVESGAIAPGDPDSSVALDRIFSDDPEEVMPPPSIKKVLSSRSKRSCSSGGSPKVRSTSRIGRSSRPRGPNCRT